jgi:hypothetical protein
VSARTAEGGGREGGRGGRGGRERGGRERGGEGDAFARTPMSARMLGCIRADAPYPCGRIVASARTRPVYADTGMRPRGRECFTPR